MQQNEQNAARTSAHHSQQVREDKQRRRAAQSEQQTRIEPVTALPPPDAVRTAPKDIKTASAAASAPPDWAALPAVQAAPAAPDGLAGQGGVSFAGG